MCLGWEQSFPLLEGLFHPADMMVRAPDGPTVQGQGQPQGFGLRWRRRRVSERHFHKCLPSEPITPESIPPAPPGRCATCRSRPKGSPA